MSQLDQTDMQLDREVLINFFASLGLTIVMFFILGYWMFFE